MNTNLLINELSLSQYSATGRLPGMATKGTKTQIVAFVPFVVKKFSTTSLKRSVVFPPTIRREALMAH